MTLADDQAARLAQQRNPNVSTDRGLNSVSPYFLPTGQTSGSSVSDLAASWANTSDQIQGSINEGKAKVQQAFDLRSAQQAARAQDAANAATQAAAEQASQQAATALADQARSARANQQAQQAQIDALRVAVGRYAGQQQRAQQQQVAPGKVTKGVKTGASGSYSIGKGIDSESQGAIAHARANGYGLGAANYSKTYQSNPNLSAARNKAMMLATSYLGTRYVLGGESQSGIDCSGLVQAVYTQLGFRVPTHSAADQGGTGGRGMSRALPGIRVAWGSSSLKPGDIIAWKSGNHIAIYAGNGQIIEAANTKVGTVRRPLWDSPGNVVGIHLSI
jgi:cell wall-associated NlpC family hydrolase